MTELRIGQKINELTVKKKIPHPKDVDKYKSWNTNKWLLCECSCGKIIPLPEYGVVSGKIKSCGHYRAEKSAKMLAKLKEEHPHPTAIAITYMDKTMNLSAWAEETGIPRTTLSYRLNKGMPLDAVFSKEKQ